jgi:hypothetical protein
MPLMQTMPVMAEPMISLPAPRLEHQPVYLSPRPLPPLPPLPPPPKQRKWCNNCASRCPP